MFADTQSVTIGGTAVPVPRSGISLTEGQFTSADGAVTFNISHRSGKRNSHLIKLSKTAIVADPLFPSQNQSLDYSAHIVIGHPKNGIAAADVLALANALIVWASSANLSKVIGFES